MSNLINDDLSVLTTLQLMQVKAASSHASCLLCGNTNPLSFHLNFYSDPNNVVYAKFTGHNFLQGYKGIVHGGVICSLLDSAMTHCLFNQKVEGVTGELNVKFIKPVEVNKTLYLKSWVEKKYEPLFYVNAELTDGQKTLASGKAKFITKST